MGAPFPPRGWGLWVLDGIVAVWQVVGRGSPSCPLSPRRGQASLAGSGQRCRAGAPRGEWSAPQWAGGLGRVWRPCGQASSSC